MTENKGLLYMRARYYDPNMRRFISADPIFGSIDNAVTLNRYVDDNGRYTGSTGLGSSGFSASVKKTYSETLGEFNIFDLLKSVFGE